MRCIFCKSDSSSSKSVEHIIPESLYNTRHILPPRIVCDSCNNYFARKVEKPFLDSPAISHLRFHEGIPNKRGRIPSSEGILLPGFEITVYKELNAERQMFIDMSAEARKYISQQKMGQFIFPRAKKLPGEQVISRFLAKMALEAMALKLLDIDGGIEYLTEENQLDPLRNFARRGDPPNWPHHIRKIYPQEQQFRGVGGRIEQNVHEFDFLVTKTSEWYFVFALFGVELTINLGGPEIGGYLKWLEENHNASPLYSGKNAVYLKELILNQ
jgi:hypothetical protein